MGTQEAKIEGKLLKLELQPFQTRNVFFQKA